MNGKNKQTKKPKNLILLIMVSCFVALSFVGGIQEYTFSVLFGGEPISRFYIAQGIGNTGYAPVLCCKISLIELLLLFFGNGIRSRIAGLILNTVKVVAPLPVIRTVYLVSSDISGFFFSQYVLSVYGCFLIGFGMLIAFEYVKEIHGMRMNAVCASADRPDN